VPDRPTAEVRTLLAKFGLTAEHVLRPADTLSPGERTRAGLALLQARGVNVLVLDEPTNHLDLPAIEQLEQALASYDGALLLVSHDRALLDAVGTRTVAVEDGTLHSYVGGWAEYVRVREERAEAERVAKRSKPAKAAPPRPPVAASAAAPSKNQRRQAERLEAEIEAAEAALSALEVELADPTAWNDPRSAAKSTRRHEQAKRALQELYAQWETVAG